MNPEQILDWSIKILALAGSGYAVVRSVTNDRKLVKKRAEEESQKSDRAREEINQMVFQRTKEAYRELVNDMAELKSEVGSLRRELNQARRYNKDLIIQLVAANLTPCAEPDMEIE